MSNQLSPSLTRLAILLVFVLVVATTPSVQAEESDSPDPTTISADAMSQPEIEALIAECQSGATCHTVSGRQTPAGELDIDTAVACDTTSEHCYSLGEALANETTDVAGTVGSLPLEEAKDIASAFASHHGLIDSTPTDTYGMGESPVPHPEVPSQSDAGFMGVTDDYNAHYFDTIYYYFLAGSTVTTVGSYQSIVAIRLGLSMATSSRWQGGMAVISGPHFTCNTRCKFP